MGNKQKIVIVGAGFGGLNLVKRLDKNLWDIVIIDKNNYHSFPPLFYQVATSGLDAPSISFPLRREMRKERAHGARFHIGEVHTVDVASKTVSTQYETIAYDKLVIAAGTTNNFFGIPGLEDSVHTLKSTAEALRCRNDILERLERAAVCHDAESRRRLLTFTVVGGGPAGVEVAGALGEMKRYIVPREYPSISQDEVTINIVEGSQHLLGFMGDLARRKSEEYLRALMVNVMLGRTVKKYEDNLIMFDDGSSLFSGMVIWTAGVTGCGFTMAGTDVRQGAGRRFVVDEYNRIEGLDDVYAIGDISMHADERYPRGVPQLAQGAIQQARNLAYNLNRGKMERPFRYKDKGTMATVGRNKAVVQTSNFHLSGSLAWVMWMVVHLISLMGMRNKIVVFINWVWGYFSFSSSLRLLIRPAKNPLREKV